MRDSTLDGHGIKSLKTHFSIVFLCLAAYEQLRQLPAVKSKQAFIFIHLSLDSFLAFLHVESSHFLPLLSFQWQLMVNCLNFRLLITANVKWRYSTLFMHWINISSGFEILQCYDRLYLSYVYAYHISEDFCVVRYWHDKRCGTTLARLTLDSWIFRKRTFQPQSRCLPQWWWSIYVQD